MNKPPVLAYSTLAVFILLTSNSLSAQHNTYLGYKTGDSNTSGESNVMVGARAGELNPGSGNIFIGYQAGQLDDTSSNRLYISNVDTSVTIFGDLGSNRVAIGTTVMPSDNSYKLTVEGKIMTREIKVTQINPWPDYVFAPEYPLLSLSELEQFVNANGHLPDIPSADQVTIEGVLLGAMQAKLLQKIEELTLHTIAQQKQIEALEARLRQVENK